VVQEYLEGSEAEIFSYHAYVSPRDAVPVSFVGRKIRTLPASCGESSYLELVNNPAVSELGDAVVHKLNIRGPVKIDLKRSPGSNRYFILEVNLRYSLWNYLGARCGMNLPLIAYQDLTDNPVHPKPDRYQTDISWLDWSKDVRAVARYYVPSGQISLKQWLQSLMRPKIYAVLAWRDPLPFLVHSVRELRRRLGQLVRGAVS